MVEFFEVALLCLTAGLSFSGIGFSEKSYLAWARRFSSNRPVVLIAVGGCTFLGCLVVASFLHEPVPRIHDEFSYLLMADTLAHGHVANPSPPLFGFFDTFHVLVHPVYASKYFPANGLFLAIGQKLTGHAAVGIWIGSALACAATCWMLQNWVGNVWALVGGFLMMVQIGVYSYWSQAYWGGMVAALGGALFFGSVRRLWVKLSWWNAILMASGLVILANSRPLEGFLAALPASCLFLRRIWMERLWKQPTLWRDFALPAGMILLLGAALTGAYNRAITGSAWKPPYLLHEQQYQESPQFIFLPLRPRISYSSPWVKYYYEISEMRLYISQRTPTNVMITAARKLMTWWAFYCGILMSAPLLLAVWLRGGRVKYFQAAVLAGFIIVAAVYVPRSAPLRIIIDSLALAQIGILWFAFDEFWSRLAIGTSTLLIFASFFVKYSFPHYFAPAASLVLFLQVEALRRIWHWQGNTHVMKGVATRSERRRAARSNAESRPAVSRLRGLVTLLPLACVLSLGLRLEGRVNDWSIDSHGPDRYALLMQDWSLRRADLEHWLEQQQKPELVFVRYSPHHNVNAEWVYNNADLIHSHVIWARDLGFEQNRLLIQYLPDRTVWSLDADRPEPQLVPYTEQKTDLNPNPSGIKPEEDPLQ